MFKKSNKRYTWSLYAEDMKTLLKIKKTNLKRDISCSGIRRLTIVRMSIFSKSVDSMKPNQNRSSHLLQFKANSGITIKYEQQNSLATREGGGRGNGKAIITVKLEALKSRIITRT